MWVSTVCEECHSTSTLLSWKVYHGTPLPQLEHSGPSLSPLMIKIPPLNASLVGSPGM